MQKEEKTAKGDEGVPLRMCPTLSHITCPNLFCVRRFRVRVRVRVWASVFKSAYL